MRFILAVLMLALTSTLPAEAQVRAQVYSLKAHPFGIGYTRDGQYLFVTQMGRGASDAANGITAFAVTTDGLQQIGFTATPGSAADMVQTHDGKLIVIASQSRVVFVDPARLIAGGADAVLGDIHTSDRNSSINAMVSNDDHWLFIAEEYDDRLTVIDLDRLRASGFRDKAILGHIPMPKASVGMAVSPDGRYLYATSEVGDSQMQTCPNEAGNGQMHAPGELTVIDIATAASEPKKAVVAHVPAGCNPVRVILSHDGRQALVTARGGGEVLAFDTQSLLNASDKALLGRVAIGPSPVGAALSQDGQTLVVADSDRFGGARAHPELAVVDVSGLAQGHMTLLRRVSSGRFPREVAMSPDGRSVAVGDFGSGNLLMLNLADLRTSPSP